MLAMIYIMPFSQALLWLGVMTSSVPFPYRIAPVARLT